MVDSGSRRGVDGGTMLPDPATDGIGTHQEHSVAPGKRLGQRCRVVQVTVADVGTTSAELVQSLRMARDEDEVLWRDALQQLLGDKVA